MNGFVVIFPSPLQAGELHWQQSPAVGGPWSQNAFAIVPPNGAEWDVETNSTAGTPLGILPGETG